MTPSPTATPTPTPTPTPRPTVTPKPFVLKMKSKGADVRQLQQRLISLGYLADKEADGIFGSKAEKAVKQFQRNHDIKQSGIVDQDLWDLMMSDTAIAAFEYQSATPSPTIELTETIPHGTDAGIPDSSPVFIRDSHSFLLRPL